MTNRDTDIDSVGDGGATAIVAGLLVVVAVVIGIFFFFGANHATSETIDVTRPHLSADATQSG